MRTLIWAVYLGGLLVAGLLGGRVAIVVYLVASGFAVTVFRRPLVLWLTHLSSRLGLMRETIEKMPSAIALTRAPGPADTARPILAPWRPPTSPMPAPGTSRSCRRSRWR